MRHSGLVAWVSRRRTMTGAAQIIDHSGTRRGRAQEMPGVERSVPGAPWTHLSGRPAAVQERHGSSI